MKGHTPHSLEGVAGFIRSKNIILFYTCNAPSQKVLNKYGIVTSGDKFGCANPREILQIPLSLYNKAGFYDLDDKEVLEINVETLIRNLKKKIPLIK